MHRVTKWGPDCSLNSPVWMNVQPCDSSRSAQVVSKSVAAYLCQLACHLTSCVTPNDPFALHAEPSRGNSPPIGLPKLSTPIIHHHGHGPINLCNAVLSFMQKKKNPQIGCHTSLRDDYSTFGHPSVSCDCTNRVFAEEGVKLETDILELLALMACATIPHIVRLQIIFSSCEPEHITL